MAIISVVMVSLLIGIAAENTVEKQLLAESDSTVAELLEWELPSRLKTVMPYYVSGYDYEDRPVIVMETGRWYTRLIVEKDGEDVLQLEKSIDQFVERVLMGYFRDQRNRSDTQTDDDEFVAILDFDGYNFQELNSPAIDRKLYELVTSHMLHGPCSERGMNNGVCSKRFPKAYCESTDTSADGFPAYRRRDDGVTFVRGKDKDGKDIVFTNQHVVPYNPYLLLKYNCHINVEVCSSVKAVKYIYKYIYKGHDCADLLLNETETTVNVDEIGQHVNARYVSAPEAMWRLYGFLMQEKSHTIYRLNFHEPNEQTLYYRAGDEEQALDNVKDSTLTAYFKLNQSDEIARQYLYSDIPNYYWFTDVTDNNKIQFNSIQTLFTC